MQGGKRQGLLRLCNRDGRRRMSIYQSQTYLNDLRETIASCGVLDELAGSSVLITGGTGLICSAVADVLLMYNEVTGNTIDVYLAGRNQEAASRRFARFVNSPRFHFVPYDARSGNHFPFHADYIIHGASNASPAAFQAHPVDTMLDNFNGLHELLRFGLSAGSKNVLFISSSEVYGKKESMEPFKEGEYGYLDILGERASYPSAKRAAETLCVSFAGEFGIRTTIARPGHVYGPTARREDSRVSSAFAFDAADGKNLVMKSDGSQIRSYCYTLDCATAVLTILVRGESRNAYNISNADSIISIREMAELLAKSGGVEASFGTPSEEEKISFNPMNNSSLNAEKLESLGWKGIFSAEKGLGNTVKIIREAGL